MSSSRSLVAHSITKPLSLTSECGLTFKLALPLIIGQVGQMLIGLADTVMIARLGVVPLGAATFANTLLVLPMMLGFGMLSSISVKVSQAHGANSPEEAASAVRHGTWLSAGFGVLTVLLSIAVIPFLGNMRQPPEVVAITPIYLVVCAISIIPAMLSLAWKSHADAMNRPWVPFWIQLGGVFLDIFLNWVFIWGKFGVPAFGMNGAAYSTLISRSITAVVMYQWMMRASFAKDWVPKQWFIRCQSVMFRALLAIGIPSSLHLLTEVGAFAVCTLVIGSLGAEPLAAHQVAINCAATTFMVPLGIAMAMTVRVGEVIGTGEVMRLKRILLSGWIFAVGFMGLSMTCFLVFGQWISEQFVADAHVIRIAAKLLIIAGLFQLVDGFQVICSFALRGMNDVNVPAKMAFVAYWIVALPVGLWLGLHLQWGAEGLWWGLASGLAVAAVVLGYRAWKLLVISTARVQYE